MVNSPVDPLRHHPLEATTMHRREFLRSTAAASLALTSNAWVHGASTKTHRAGLIGSGWYGMVDLRHLMDSGRAEVVALCDVDKKNLKEAAAEVADRQKERPQLFHDFREMLRPKNLDVVLIGTPDHWHALTAIAAMEAGADVHCEKPISHTFLEGKAMVSTARRLSRVVQINTQRRSTPHFIKAREFIKEGKLGAIGEVKAYGDYNMRPMDNAPAIAAAHTLDYAF